MQTLNNISSTAVESLSLDRPSKTALVEFKNGRKYTYSNVNDSAIESALLNPAQSIGKWVNKNCIQDSKVDYTFGYGLNPSI